MLFSNTLENILYTAFKIVTKHFILTLFFFCMYNGTCFSIHISWHNFYDFQVQLISFLFNNFYWDIIGVTFQFFRPNIVYIVIFTSFKLTSSMFCSAFFISSMHYWLSWHWYCSLITFHIEWNCLNCLMI